ncbi:DUF4148 domain-containing protein [Ramlibacter albus]|uniref:DUF4148 domain-containing protein n=1 Tax=Ramlibacter albus TaxID=2079448 RepID=A0A923S3C8_9BURK|nr:DUF4148 domain-containing protein [Ramlibacter albus]MBC5766414.1 DUF4148 domain-containing protein [Ramlibacter albus]
MNRNLAYALVVFAATAAAAGQAFAETPTLETTPFVSVKTRADVQAELAQHKANGVNTYSIQYNPLKSFKSTAQREQVVAEYIASRDVVAATTGEDSGSAYFAQARTPHSVSRTLAGTPVNTAR